MFCGYSNFFLSLQQGLIKLILSKELARHRIEGSSPMSLFAMRLLHLPSGLAYWLHEDLTMFQVFIAYWFMY